MNEEEKKAVEEMKRCIKYGIDLKNNKDVYEIEIIEIYEIILNLLAKKDKEIQYQKEINKTEQDRHKQTEKSLKGQLQKKDIEIEKLKQSKIRQLERYKKYKENIDNQHEKIYEELVEEIEIKDKTIDLMSEYIDSLDIDEDICMKNTANTELCNEEYSNCKECIKQYFGKKVEV